MFNGGQTHNKRLTKTN
jgi:hypothetical protein